VVAVTATREQILGWLDEIADPEIPVLSITDLGIVRDVSVDDDGVRVALAPTYSGCPATEVIERSVVDALAARGIDSVRIDRVLSPAWTTDWISAGGRDKLQRYGIAPPQQGAGKRSLFRGDAPAACPRCGSVQTVEVSRFGSTPCKASWRCESCLEPFEYFKCI
jgi:ring-1,2-phenylacetyl-CoA epoxidase subunit PaaD